VVPAYSAVRHSGSLAGQPRFEPGECMTPSQPAPVNDGRCSSSPRSSPHPSVLVTSLITAGLKKTSCGAIMEVASVQSDLASVCVEHMLTTCVCATCSVTQGPGESTRLRPRGWRRHCPGPPRKWAQTARACWRMLRRVPARKCQLRADQDRACRWGAGARSHGNRWPASHSTCLIWSERSDLCVTGDLVLDGSMLAGCSAVA